MAKLNLRVVLCMPQPESVRVLELNPPVVYPLIGGSDEADFRPSVCCETLLNTQVINRGCTVGFRVAYGTPRRKSIPPLTASRTYRARQYFSSCWPVSLNDFDTKDPLSRFMVAVEVRSIELRV